MVRVGLVAASVALAGARNKIDHITSAFNIHELSKPVHWNKEGSLDARSVAADAQFDQGHALNKVAAGVSKLEQSDVQGSNLERSEDQGSNSERSDDQESNAATDLGIVSLQVPIDDASNQEPQVKAWEYEDVEELVREMREAKSSSPGAALLAKALEVVEVEGFTMPEMSKPIRSIKPGKLLHHQLEQAKGDNKARQALERATAFLESIELSKQSADQKRALFDMMGLAQGIVQMLQKQKDGSGDKFPESGEKMLTRYRWALEAGAATVACAIKNKSPDEIKAILQVSVPRRRTV